MSAKHVGMDVIPNCKVQRIHEAQAVVSSWLSLLRRASHHTTLTTHRHPPTHTLQNLQNLPVFPAPCVAHGSFSCSRRQAGLQFLLLVTRRQYPFKSERGVSHSCNEFQRCTERFKWLLRCSCKKMFEGRDWESFMLSLPRYKTLLFHHTLSCLDLTWHLGS